MKTIQTSYNGLRCIPVLYSKKTLSYISRFHFVKKPFSYKFGNILNIVNKVVLFFSLSGLPGQDALPLPRRHSGVLWWGGAVLRLALQGSRYHPQGHLLKPLQYTRRLVSVGLVVS